MLQRNVFWLIALVALFVAAPVGLLVCERVRGDLEWEKYAYEARARGIKLTVAEILPAPPSDDENFGKAPIFDAAFRGSSSGALFKLPRMKGSAIEHAEVQTCQQVDLAAWRAAFVKPPWSIDETTSDAEAVLQSLEAFAPELEALDAASQRPYCRFSVNWHDPLRTPSPHVGVIVNATAVISLRGEALLKAGRADEALRDFRFLVRLFHRMKGEPGTWSSRLCRRSLICACDLVWSGICDGTWNAKALEEIEKELRDVNVLGQLRWALESDRALQNAVYDIIKKEDLLNPRSSGSTPGTAPSVRTIATLLYQGASLQLNRVRTNRYIDDLLKESDEYKQRYTPVPSAYGPTDSSTILANMQFGVSDFLDDAYQSDVKSALRTHTRVQQARIACALERYRVASGTFPSDLTALTPDLLPSVPPDVGDGRSMRYRLDPSRRYILYSIGSDQVDNGGVPSSKQNWRSKDDWIWTFPPH